MSISAMKYALQALENPWGTGAEGVANAIIFLRQAIAEAEKQEAVAWMWKDGTLTSDPDFADGTWTPLFTAPVHASDISQKCVDETAKRKHEWVGLDGDIPGLGLVTEEFYNGMLCAEDILRKKNT